MSTTNELLQLSSSVYARGEANKTPVPTGWTLLSSGSVPLYVDGTGWGFGAGAYYSATTNEVVIAFAGTEPGLADWITGNGAALGLPTSQIASAVTPTSSVGPGITVIELTGEGTDLVNSSVAHTLGNFLENLTLMGTDNIPAPATVATIHSRVVESRHL